jgi:hypothetical protein
MKQALFFVLVHRYTNKADGDSIRDKYRDAYESVRPPKNAYLDVAGLLVTTQLVHLAWSKVVANLLWQIRNCKGSLLALDTNTRSTSAGVLTAWLGSLVQNEAKGDSQASLMKMIDEVRSPVPVVRVWTNTHKHTCVFVYKQVYVVYVGSVRGEVLESLLHCFVGQVKPRRCFPG